MTAPVPDADRFATLLHAYGWADDTPAHLSALAGGDRAAREAALAHLWSAVIHQGTPWTVTPPVARVVAGLLGDDRLAGSEWAALRAGLLAFLTSVAEAGGEGPAAEVVALATPAGRDVQAELRALRARGDHGDDEEGDGEEDEDDEFDELWQDEVLIMALHARAVLGCRDVTPEVAAAARPLLADPDPTVRAAAAQTVSVCHRLLRTRVEPSRPTASSGTGPPGSPDRALVEQLTALAAVAEPDERAALVLALGELGETPRAHLDDPHPGVRACAALAPALAEDPGATAELLLALTDPAATDQWFDRRPPQWSGRPRFVLVDAVLARVDDPARLLPAALAVARCATCWTADRDWGRLLRAMFPGGWAGAGSTLTTVQHRYLCALVDNPELWNPVCGNAAAHFRQVGLTYDRETCRALVRLGPG